MCVLQGVRALAVCMRAELCSQLALGLVNFPPSEVNQQHPLLAAHQPFPSPQAGLWNSHPVAPAPQGPKSCPAIPYANLLPIPDRAWMIRDRHLAYPQVHTASFGQKLAAEFKALATECHLPQDRCRGHFVAGGLIA